MSDHNRGPRTLYYEFKDTNSVLELEDYIYPQRSMNGPGVAFDALYGKHSAGDRFTHSIYLGIMDRDSCRQLRDFLTNFLDS